MKLTDGHILIITEGLETADIPQNARNKAVVDFFDMKTIAEREGDTIYGEQGIFTNIFSYGQFYPGFVNMTWKEFNTKDSLKGIDEKTYELLQTFSQYPRVKICNDRGLFATTYLHPTHAGYRLPICLPNYIYNPNSRNQWHEQWYAEHQQNIIWPNDNNWLPRRDKAISILKRELSLHGKDIPLSEKDIATAFHDKVMRHKGPEIKAYADAIGTEICQSNYYYKENDLSKMESYAHNSPRKIFSIINQNGNYQFISIDFAHGMFEFCNSTGSHQGEYRFDGTPNSTAEPENHSLTCLDTWYHSRNNRSS